MTNFLDTVLSLWGSPLAIAYWVIALFVILRKRRESGREAWHLAGWMFGGFAIVISGIAMLRA